MLGLLLVRLTTNISPIVTFFRMYTRLVNRCFGSCVTTFRSKALDKSEIACAENCAARFLKMTQRVGLRFAEHQAMQQKRAAEGAGAIPK